MCKAASGVEHSVIEGTATTSFVLFFSDLGFPDCSVLIFVFSDEIATEKHPETFDLGVVVSVSVIKSLLSYL